MPLSEDSRALLTLLLGRGKSYADISGLLGISEDEVRTRAVRALAEVDSTVPRPDADLTDYLLGQADAITRAEVASRISDDSAVAEQAHSLTDQLRLLVPAAELPSPGSPQGGKPKSASKPVSAQPQPSAPDQVAAGKPGGTFASVTSHQRRLIAILLGAALLAAVVILLLTGVFGGGDSDDGDSETVQSSPTVAVMQPVNGQQGTGQVQFGFAGTTFAANLNLRDLEPSKDRQAYVIWLYGSSGAFPIYANKVDDSGSIIGRIDLNEAVVCLIATDIFPTLRVSRAGNKAFNAALGQARLNNRNNPRLPEFTGELVLEGQITMPQAAKDTIIPICNGTAA